MATYVYVFGAHTSSMYQKSYDANLYFLKSQEKFANELLTVRGHLFLNEILDSLGLPRVKPGAINGWIKDSEDKHISFDLDNPLNKKNERVYAQSFRLELETDGEILDQLVEETKKENSMINWPEPLTVSPSRTYVVGIYDIVCQNEVRFKRVLLPESFENNSKNARYYYQSTKENRASTVLVVVAFEDYMATVNDVVEEVIFEPPQVQKKHFFDTRSTSLAEDMKEVRRLLNAWNDEQKLPSTTYTMIMRSVLEQLDLHKKIMKELKELYYNTTC